MGDFLGEPPPRAASFQVQRPRGAWMYPDRQGDGELGREAWRNMGGVSQKSGLDLWDLD